MDVTFPRSCPDSLEIFLETMSEPWLAVSCGALMVTVAMPICCLGPMGAEILVDVDCTIPVVCRVVASTAGGREWGSGVLPGALMSSRR